MNTLEYFKQKYFFYLLIFVSVIGCNVVNHNNEKIKGGLHFSDKIIPPNSVLLIRTQNGSSFKVRGQNLSENKIVIKKNDSLQNLPNKDAFDLSINQGSYLEFINDNNQEVKLYFTVYGHKSKIISNVKNKNHEKKL